MYSTAWPATETPLGSKSDALPDGIFFVPFVGYLFRHSSF
ncbi:hypothetical protein USDA257_c00020 [Sinorhizobium fredii USDA 257]|uniref:Uncharacterized protein n=1 Tax=Sinorhizobium fredii (strain USDA 257) TaxID=1185652 RepID=I3WYA0_SINF2|nr:hypothetical protein USDA257_c00020 [Sinorhizobium fredii USDA 257]